MSDGNMQLTLQIMLGERRWTVERSEPATSLVSVIVQSVLLAEGIDTPPEQCVVTYLGRVIAPTQLLSQITGQTSGEMELWIQIPANAPRGEDRTTQTDFEVLAPSEKEEAVSLDLSGFEPAQDDDDAESPPPKPKMRSQPAPAQAPAGRMGRLGRTIVEFKKGVKGLEDEIERRITVRYYERMNPMRVVPLLVILSAREIERIVQKRVAQASSGPVKVRTDQTIEIEPILPGCTCYPPKMNVQPTTADQTVQFWVVPEVLGKIPGAYVRVSQGDKPLSEIKLEMRVVKQTLAKITGVLTLALPFLSSIAKHYRLDFESQLGDGFSLYLTAANAITNQISTPVLAGGLAVLTFIFYLMCRPKKRDLFFDVLPQK